MTNINLYQSSGDQNQKRNDMSAFFDTTFFLSIGMVVVVLLGLGGISYYNSVLTKENAALSVQIMEHETNGLSGDAVDSVVDFQTRLDYMGTKVDENIKNKKLLDTVAKAFLPGVLLNKFAFDSGAGKATLSMWATDYRKIAAQLLNFKIFKDENSDPKVNNFSQVEISEIKRAEKGVEFTISMNIANLAK